MNHSAINQPLPAEIWYTVFKHLTVKDRISVGKVCRVWLQINQVNEVILYNSEMSHPFPFGLLPIESKVRVVSWEQVLYTIQSFTRIKRLQFIGNFRYDDERTFKAIGDLLSDTKSMKLFRSNIASRHLLFITHQLSSLEELSFIHSQKAANVMNELMTRNPRLKSIAISGFKNENPLLPFNQPVNVFKYSVTLTGKLFNVLSTLHETSAQTLETLLIANVYPSNCIDFLASFKNLRDLRISFYWFESCDWQSKLVFERLEVLTIYPFGTRLDSISFITRNRHLKVLALGFLMRITDAMISELSECCPGLQVLIMRNTIHLTEECFQYFKQFRQLEQLQLIDCSQLSDTGMSTFVKQSPSLHVLRFDGSRKKATVTAMKQVAITKPNKTFWAYFNGEKKYDSSPPNLMLVNPKSKEIETWNYFFDFQLYYRQHPNDDFFAWKRYKP